MAEVDLEAEAREMSQRDEGFLMSAAMLEQVALHLGVTASVPVLVAESTKRLRSGVPLLGRIGLVVDQDLIDDRLEGTEHRRGAIPNRRGGLGMVEDLPDGNSREIECPGDLPDGLAIALRPPNGTVIVHRKHFLDLRRVSDSMRERSL